MGQENFFLSVVKKGWQEQQQLCRQTTAGPVNLSYPFLWDAGTGSWEILACFILGGCSSPC